MTERDETLVLYSKLALYPVHWLALEEQARAIVRPIWATSRLCVRRTR